MSPTWKAILIWFSLSVILLSLSREWTVVIFALTYGCLYGGTVYFLRDRLRSLFTSLKKGRFALYLLVAITVSVFEEIYVYLLGGKIAVSNIFLDIIIVPGEWSVWFATWYLFSARKFKFTYGQALLAAGLEGIFFEYIGNGLFLNNPIGFVISIPIAVVVYAAIFILPMQLIEFKGETDSLWKYPVAVILPYLLSIPAALILYAVFL